MASGGYFLVKNEEAGAALVGSGVSMIAIQQIEEHKRREKLDTRDNPRDKIEELNQAKILELQSDNEKLNYN